MFKAHQPHNWVREDVYFDKGTGKHYTLDNHGKPVATQNPLTDPNYKPIDYSGYTGQNWEDLDYLDFSQ